jgi:hypothetical protein
MIETAIVSLFLGMIGGAITNVFKESISSSLRTWAQGQIDTKKQELDMLTENARAQLKSSADRDVEHLKDELKRHSDHRIEAVKADFVARNSRLAEEIKHALQRQNTVFVSVHEKRALAMLKVFAASHKAEVAVCTAGNLAVQVSAEMQQQLDSDMNDAYNSFLYVSGEGDLLFPTSISNSCEVVRKRIFEAMLFVRDWRAAKGRDTEADNQRFLENAKKALSTARMDLKSLMVPLLEDEPSYPGNLLA